MYTLQELGARSTQSAHLHSEGAVFQIIEFPPGPALRSQISGDTDLDNGMHTTDSGTITNTLKPACFPPSNEKHMYHLRAGN